MTPAQQRFVACCQHLLTLGLLAVVVAPAVSVAPLEVVGPEAPSSAAHARP